ncbi:hypothetical protein [Treponema sp.]|uniref:hypothetical protein n=1 Tax=Treponema sp. TaxID=166 RepID=UPI00298E102B|nr:hypothetical protein [Treponema sp.]MCR5612222.1 hypothetical protein [Treponema sp.]
MIPVCICGGCGRTIEKEFVYCPWCGQSKLSTMSESDKMDEIFSRLEEMQYNDRTERIEKIGNRLDALEKELDALVLCAEMHK